MDCSGEFDACADADGTCKDEHLPLGEATVSHHRQTSDEHESEADGEGRADDWPGDQHKGRTELAKQTQEYEQEAHHNACTARGYTRHCNDAVVPAVSDVGKCREDGAEQTREGIIQQTTLQDEIEAVACSGQAAVLGRGSEVAHALYTRHDVSDDHRQQQRPVKRHTVLEQVWVCEPRRIRETIVADVHVDEPVTPPSRPVRTPPRAEKESEDGTE
mmetsp:Transcript_14911/g.42828  ORF Transcript_14911/g.42828 Transcript_14911/m.42828 type:complete len:217 (+) Transcript_14911:1134-1784(+)